MAKELFVEKLDAMPDDAWESVVEWGLPQLVQEPDVLLSVLIDRANFRHQRDHSVEPVDELARIIDRLGLRLTVGR